MAGTRQRCSGCSHARQKLDLVLRMLVTGRLPGTPDGEGKPQRGIASSRPFGPLRTTGAIWTMVRIRSTRSHRYTLDIFDYGAPAGLHVAMRRPEQVSAIITQNGNAYLEELSDGWGPFKVYWADPTPAAREACRQATLTDAALHDQYEHGAPLEGLSPDELERPCRFRSA